MSLLMEAAHARLPFLQRRPLPPARLMARLLGLRAPRAAVLAAHFLYGGAAGVPYAWVPSKSAVAGAAYGFLVWAGSYFGWIRAVPALRKAGKENPRRHALMAAAHVVWGAALEFFSRQFSKSQEEPMARHTRNRKRVVASAAQDGAGRISPTVKKALMVGGLTALATAGGVWAYNRKPAASSVARTVKRALASAW